MKQSRSPAQQWTPEMIEQLRKLVALGTPPAQIAQALDRSLKAVRSRLCRHGIRYPQWYVRAVRIAALQSRTAPRTDIDPERIRQQFRLEEIGWRRPWPEMSEPYRDVDAATLRREDYVLAVMSEKLRRGVV